MNITDKEEKWFQSIVNADVKTIKEMIESGFVIKNNEFVNENTSNWISLNKAEKEEEVYKMIEILIQNGIYLEERSPFGDIITTDSTFIKKFPNVVKLLIESGLDIEHQNDMGGNVLTCSLMHSKSDLIDWLIEKGMDINHKNKKGQTFAEIAQKITPIFRRAIIYQLTRHWDILNTVQQKIVEKERLRTLFHKRVIS